MSITPLPPAPAPTDSTQQFNEKAFDWVASLGDFTTETNALAVAVTNDKNTTASIVGAAQVSANAAASSATAAAGSASAALGHASAAAANTNAPLWVSGTTYAAGALVYSALTGRTYRRKTAGGGTTDPSADTANWTALFLEIQTQRPTIRPSLLLDFANTKRLDPRITFARASAGTFYDGRTVAKAEENLFLRSQEFSFWTPTRTTVTENTTTAPDGTLTADSVTQASGQTTSGTVSRSVSVNAGDVVASVFAKPNGKNFLVIRESLTDGTTKSTWFNVSTGAAGSTNASHVATITASTESFYRCSIKLTANAARTASVDFFVADTDGSLTVTDSGGLILWGAQLEQRSAITAYQVTTTQPITNYIPVLQSAADNVARFDHSPTTGESLGFLVEESRTNLLTYSEQFDDAAWTKSNSTITANTIVAPDGALTGDKLVETTATGGHIISVTFSVSSGTTYTYSLNVKLAERTNCYMLFGSSGFGTNVRWDFDLTAGTATRVTAGTADAASITPIGNGWYRITMTAQATATTTPTIQFGLKTTVVSYTGDGYSGIFIWGAQLEAGAFPTSYIPTVASQVTRAADAATMTGANFSNWFSQGEGTLYANINTTASSVNRTTMIFEGAAVTSRIEMLINASNLVNPATVIAGVSGANINNGTYTAGTEAKIAFAYKVGDYASAFNGATAVTNTFGGLIPTVEKLNIGSRSTGNNINGHIRKIAFYPKALSATELQALTS
jgi:hypothetical protein